jgi:hypothetical protein
MTRKPCDRLKSSVLSARAAAFVARERVGFARAGLKRQAR